MPLTNPLGYVFPATTHKMGFVQLATNAEAVAGTNAYKAITPASLAAALIGPSPGAFTTLSSTSTTSLATQATAVALDLASGVGGNTITMGNGINTGAQTVSIANGASAANTTVSIMSGIGTAGAGVLAIGNNTRVTTIDIGNIAPAAARTTTISGGNSAQSDTLNILAGNPSAGTQTVNVLSGTSTGGTQVVNIASGASASTTTIGNTTSTTTLNLKAGSGGIQTSGFLTHATNPCALGYLASAVANATGNGATYTLGSGTALTVLFDKGTNLSTAGVFTAPATGVYRISAQIAVTATTIATTFTLKLIVTGTSARTYEKVISRAASSLDQYVSHEVIAPMTATDTFTVTLVAAGEAGNTESIVGAATLTDTFMTATKVA